MKLSRRSLIAASASLPWLIPAAVRAQAAPVPVRVAGLPAEPALPFAYAMRAGLFERAGLRIESSKMTSGSAIAAAVAGNAIDIGLSSTYSLLVGRAKGVPFVLIAPANLWLPSSQGGLVVALNSPLRAPKDFVGKIVSAAAINDMNAVAMQAWLDQSGVDSKDVKFLEIPQMSAPAALDQGRIDGAIITNPAYAVAMASGRARFVANVYSAIAPRFLLGAWFTTSIWVAANHSAAERFSRVMANATIYTAHHPNETVDDLVSYTGIERSVAVNLKRSAFAATLLASDLQPLIDASAKYKGLERAFPASEILSDAAAK